MTEIPGSQPPLVDPTQPVTPAQPDPPPAAAAAQPAAPPPAQPYAQPVAPYAPAVYPPPKKGPSALKIVLIIVGIFVGLGIIAAGFAGYEIYRIAKSANMTASSQPVTAADLGAPLYPGAVQGKSVRMTVLGMNVLTANFFTSDSKEQVAAFYQDNLGPDAQVIPSSNGKTFKLGKGAGESVMVTIPETTSAASGRTQIVIVHTTKAAAQSN